MHHPDGAVAVGAHGAGDGHRRTQQAASTGAAGGDGLAANPAGAGGVGPGLGAEDPGPHQLVPCRHRQHQRSAGLGAERLDQPGQCVCRQRPRTSQGIARREDGGSKIEQFAGGRPEGRRRWGGRRTLEPFYRAPVTSVKAPLVRPWRGQSRFRWANSQAIPASWPGKCSGHGCLGRAAASQGAPLRSWRVVRASEKATRRRNSAISDDDGDHGVDEPDRGLGAQVDAIPAGLAEVVEAGYEGGEEVLVLEPHEACQDEALDRPPSARARRRLRSAPRW